MQVSIEAGEGLERRMTVKLPSEQINKEVDKRLRHIARTARLDGFRPGKVPFSIIRQRYSGSVRQEVFGDLIQSSFIDAIRQEDLKPAGEPRIELTESGDDTASEYTAVFEIFPEFDLADLHDLSIRRPLAEVTDDDVDTMLEKLRKQRVTWNRVDRPAIEGDQVRISFKGMMDGEPFAGGEGADVPLELGTKSMIEGFEEGLIGAAAGDSRSLELQFPDDYRVEHLAGKPATFEVQVNEVSEPVLPEVNEEFARFFGVTEGGVDALREDVRASMQRELEQRIRTSVKKQVMDALLEANDIDLPTVLVDGEISRLQQQAREQVAGSGGGGNMELPRGMFEEEARRRLALGLIVNKIVAANAIELDVERVRQTVERFASEYEDPEEVVKWYYGNLDRLANVQSLVLEDQVVDWLMGQLTVTDEPTTFSALTEDATES